MTGNASGESFDASCLPRSGVDPTGQGFAQPASAPVALGTARARNAELGLSGGRHNGLAEAQQQYRAANNAARRSVVNDKRNHWKRAAAQLEELYKRGNLHEAYKEVHLKTGDAKQAMPEQLKRVNGELVIGKRENADLKQQLLLILCAVAECSTGYLCRFICYS